MMGKRRTDQPELFYGFSLERHVPSDHLLRSIDRSWIWVTFASGSDLPTARLVGPRSIPS